MLNNIISSTESQHLGFTDIGICSKCNKNKIYSIKTKIGVVIKQKLCDDCQSMILKDRKEGERHDKISKLYEWANLPPIAHNVMFKATFLSDKNPKIVKILQDTKITKKMVLPYIYGPPGVGKTYLAYCFANKAIGEYLCHTYFVNFPSLLQQQKTIISRGGYFHHPNWDLITILIIDDLWNHTITNWSLEIMYHIIDIRLKYKLPTLITSNISPFSLKEHLKITGKESISQDLCNALTDRIFELCTPAKMIGESLRIKNALTRAKKMNIV